MIARMHPALPLWIGAISAVVAVFVGYGLGWSNGAIGTICLVIIGAMVIWREELTDPGRSRPRT